MSFSFGVRGATLEDAARRIAAQMEEVVKTQPVHAADRELVNTTAQGYIGLLAADDSSDVVVSVCGSISTDTSTGVRSVSISINCHLSAKEQPK